MRFCASGKTKGAPEFRDAFCLLPRVPAGAVGRTRCEFPRKIKRSAYGLRSHLQQQRKKNTKMKNVSLFYNRF